MTKQTKSILKTYFDTGDIPTQGQYRDLIDSQLNLAETDTQVAAGTISSSFLEVENDITASGNISASGTITAQNFILGSVGGIFVQDTSGNTDDTAIANLADTNIVFGDSDMGSTLRGTTIELDASSTITLDSDSGLVQFRDGGVASTIQFNTTAGHITASGNISASGTIFANDFQSSGGDVSGVTFHDDLNITGSITASGDISSSATVIGNVGTFTTLTNVNTTHVTASGNIEATGNAIVDGDVFISRYIRHTGDNDTHIEFLDNKIQLHAGNLPFITIDKDASTPFPLTINNGGNRINFRVQDKDSNLLLKTDSEAFKVNLYHAGNQKLETTVDGINVTGHITASGNLKIDGSNVDFSGLPTSDPGVAGRLYNDSGTIKISL
tara:strand:+ start:331 stop:1482 length:1152 start_codon:yes stop_codon:yes gene_type:complete